METELTIRDTTFYFHQMPTLEGFDLLETLREKLQLQIPANTVNDLVAYSGRPNGAQMSDMALVVLPALTDIIGKVLALDAVFVRQVRQALFKHVYFANQPGASRQVLLGAEATAFEKLSPAAIYRVLAQALVVNFTESWEYLASSLPTGDLISLPSVPAVSPPPSPP